MPKFYFTYGSEGQPFCGGWTEIEAQDEETARNVFRVAHPNNKDGFMVCCSVYDEERFRRTSMYERGNMGLRCHERITFTREVAPVQKGIVITVNDAVSVREFSERTATLYEGLEAVVGGCVEIVRPNGLPYPYCMVVNESGCLEPNPKPNLYGCHWYGTAEHGNPIVGTVVLMKETGFGEDRTLTGLTEDDILFLKRFVIEESGETVRKARAVLTEFEKDAETALR